MSLLNFISTLTVFGFLLTGCNANLASLDPSQSSVDESLVGLDHIKYMLDKFRTITEAPKSAHVIAEHQLSRDNAHTQSSGQFTILENPHASQIPEDVDITVSEQFTAQAELYCFGAGCSASYFFGSTTIIINEKDHTLIFDQLNLISIDGMTVKGNIRFNTADILNVEVIEHTIRLGADDISLNGESSAIFDPPIDGHPGYAGFQFRDHDHDIILDLVSQF